MKNIPTFFGSAIYIALKVSTIINDLEYLFNCFIQVYSGENETIQ